MTDFIVVLDASVLVGACLRDALLRQAEKPAAYLPRWSDHIIAEVRRTLLGSHFNLTSDRVTHLLEEMEKAFPCARVTGYEPLIPAMTNDPKDRHVLATAIKCAAQTIVTMNLKHFPAEHLAHWGIEAQHPDDFLVHQYHLDRTTTIGKLCAQARDVGRSLPELLPTLAQSTPKFVKLLSKDLAI